ncbi:hypothetical protein [Xenorhabdus sp. PR6a]|uniref:hypothetical protein n=1 Tax=Xenorhabdus sp. PR6a TaxID=3025877 RepID=UPI002359A1C6|nr:hypothetical protein [Xenorhabdus sp. PR6a]
MVEDVCLKSKQQRLSVVSHGALGLMGTDKFKNVGPQGLIDILRKRGLLVQNKQIRLLFCQSADENIFKKSFAAKFSELLPEPDMVTVEGYRGKLVMKTSSGLSSKSLDTSYANLQNISIPPENNTPTKMLHSVIEPRFAVNTLFKPTGENGERSKFIAATLSHEEQMKSFDPVNYVLSDGPYFYRNGKLIDGVRYLMQRLEIGKQ